MTVIALVIYLITPDRLPGEGDKPSSPAISQAWQMANADVPAENPQLTSDEVSVLDRAGLLPRNVERDTRLPLPASNDAHLGDGQWRLLREAGLQVLSTPRPDLAALQVFRC